VKVSWSPQVGVGMVDLDGVSRTGTASPVSGDSIRFSLCRQSSQSRRIYSCASWSPVVAVRSTRATRTPMSAAERTTVELTLLSTSFAVRNISKVLSGPTLPLIGTTGAQSLSET